MKYLQLRYIKFTKRQFIIIMDQQKKIVPQYINAKAGMNSVNAEIIARKVAELTNGTPKDIHQRQLQKKRSLQVAMMVEKLLKYKKEDREQIKNLWGKKIKQMQQQRPLNKYWGHLDFDMFYVACQLLDKPEYKDLPCAVGGQNSVLCTANYAARLFGVRAAMPTFIAKKLCPQIHLFKPEFQKYRKFSQIFRQILRRFDPNLQSHGLDEAYVDLTQILKDKSLEQQSRFIKSIRDQIFQKTGLTVSCGVGANKLLAKMASQINKPNGQFLLQNRSEAILSFMRDKKIRKIHGIGPVNQFFLKGLGIQCAKDIIQNTDVLAICFSQNSCQFFISSAIGLGSLQHQFKQRKSVGKSQTFKPNSEKQFLQAKLLQLCEQVQHELEQLGFVSINVVLSYQHQNYDRKDKTFNLDKYSSSKQILFNAAIPHLRSNILLVGKKIRLLGVKCTNLLKIDQWKRKTLQAFFNKAKDKEKGRSQSKPKQIKMEKSIPKKIEEQVHQSQIKEQKKTKSLNMQSQIISEVKQKGQFICPICNQEVPCMNNLSAFNRHIDKCLKTFK